MAQTVLEYKGYTLEISSVAVDVIDPNHSMYLATKVSLKTAMKVIRIHQRFLRMLDLDRRNQMP